MSKELAKKPKAEVAIPDQAVAPIMEIQQFTKRINEDVPKDALCKTADGKKDAISISHVEMMLDEIFFGHWSLDEVHYQREFNEVIGSGILTVRHPVTGANIRRAGFASIVITQAKDTPLSDFNSAKQKNALDLAFPKLKAEILKNAAKSLGKVFGRDLNRAQEDQYTPEVQIVEPSPITESQLDEIKKLLAEMVCDSEGVCHDIFTEQQKTETLALVTRDGCPSSTIEKVLKGAREKVKKAIADAAQAVAQ